MEKKGPNLPEKTLLGMGPVSAKPEDLRDSEPTVLMPGKALESVTLESPGQNRDGGVLDVRTLIAGAAVETIAIADSTPKGSEYTKAGTFKMDIPKVVVQTREQADAAKAAAKKAQAIPPGFVSPWSKPDKGQTVRLAKESGALPSTYMPRSAVETPAEVPGNNPEQVSSWISKKTMLIIGAAALVSGVVGTAVVHSQMQKKGNNDQTARTIPVETATASSDFVQPTPTVLASSAPAETSSAEMPDASNGVGGGPVARNHHNNPKPHSTAVAPKTKPTGSPVAPKKNCTTKDGVIDPWCDKE